MADFKEKNIISFPSSKLTIANLPKLISGSCFFTINESSKIDLSRSRKFVDFLLDNQQPAYGISTGVGSLRNKAIPSNEAAMLSTNLIRSHDAGIGKSLSASITLGAMIISANSLAKGFSGFSTNSLQTLVGMINAKIIPEIPETGSLGASGDLAFLARLGRAMMGDPVTVRYQNNSTPAHKALQQASILPFKPQAKEGLALINGTSFMTSMICTAYNLELTMLDNLIACTGLFLNAIEAEEAAFLSPIHDARHQNGQSFIAKILLPFFQKSTPPSSKELQNDYCIRCLPQIYGPRIEIILEQYDKINAELNAVTDNPLIFNEDRLPKDFPKNHSILFEGEMWALLSGGNFHGENLTTIADCIALSNAKLALTLERQMAYIMNPNRNHNHLPSYLVPENSKLNNRSGYMITQYTVNALTHKICLYAQPSSLMNCSSANESEDVVSYGATACHKLIEQISLMNQLLSIYLTSVSQAYSISRTKHTGSNQLAEKLFWIVQQEINFPQYEDDGFSEKYQSAAKILASKQLIKAINSPITASINLKGKDYE